MATPARAQRLQLADYASVLNQKFVAFQALIGKLQAQKAFD
jgi:hypothetical protein